MKSVSLYSPLSTHRQSDRSLNHLQGQLHTLLIVCPSPPRLCFITVTEPIMFEYKHLTPEEREHFLTHGWLRVPNAINPKYLTEWMENLWVRLGWDEHDKSTWEEEYIKLPRHREVPTEEFCPEAWAKMCEVVGGEERVDPVRERYFGDQFIINLGSEHWKGHERGWGELTGWHTDNDWCVRPWSSTSGIGG